MILSSHVLIKIKWITLNISRLNSARSSSLLMNSISRGPLKFQSWSSRSVGHASYYLLYLLFRPKLYF